MNVGDAVRVTIIDLDLYYEPFAREVNGRDGTIETIGELSSRPAALVRFESPISPWWSYDRARAVAWIPLIDLVATFQTAVTNVNGGTK